MLMVGGRLICWNCRGAKSGDFLRELKKLQRVHKPLIIVLTEPRISGEEIDVVYRKMGKTHCSQLEAMGFSGGV